MKLKRIAGVVVGTIVLFSVCAVAPASAINNIKGFGVQETLKDFSSEIGYTVKNLKPSIDVVPFPVAGRLYEAGVTTDAVVGTVSPQITNFLARTPGGADYRVLSNVSTLSGAPLAPGSSASGKLYFDVVGENPDSVIYNSDFQDLLGWVGLQPIDTPDVVPVPTTSGGSSTDAGSSPGGDAADNGGTGVPGSTGPNKASPPDVDSPAQTAPYGPYGSGPYGRAAPFGNNN